MAGAPRITLESVELFDVIEATFKGVIADGEITAEELEHYLALKAELRWLLSYTDRSVAAVVTATRRGIDAPSFRRRLAEQHVRLVHSADEHDAAHIKSALH